MDQDGRMTHVVAAAVAFCWLGMVLGISFLEAPLKFRAPGVTLAVGLGIGRLVFRALNRVEVGLLVVLVVTAVITAVLGPPDPVLHIGTGALVVLLGVQLIAVRPRLNRRSDLVLAGGEAPRSRAHHGYIALEVLKVAALITVGVAALTG
jgi:hypothetical protein